jgi:hypothetical protein
MNKQLIIIIRVVERLYIAALVLYLLVAGYQVTIARLVSPASTIPVLSTSLLQSNAKALENRLVLSDSAQYTASASGVFGKSEPFNP